MAQNYQKIGDYISVLDIRNIDGRITNLMGISIDKCYIPSVANVIGTDLHNYKVIRKGQFSCSLMQVSRDQRIPLAMYKSDEPAIMSPAYVMFEVNRPDDLLPEYMELWFKRAEFDREASFYAVGGVRGSLDWDDFCNMKLPVPPISEQRKIVHDYQVITDRIELLRKIDDNLFQTAKAYMTNLYETDDAWQSDVSINDYCHNIASGGTPNRSENSYWENASIPWLKNGEIKNNVIVDTDEYISKTGMDNSSARLFPAYSIHMAMYCVSEIQVAVSCIPLTTNQAVLNFEFDSFREASFFYYLLATYGNEITSNANGSAQQNLSKELITAFVFKKPSIEKEYFTFFEKNLDYRISIAKELASMQACADLVLTHL